MRSGQGRCARPAARGAGRRQEDEVHAVGGGERHAVGAGRPGRGDGQRDAGVVREAPATVICQGMPPVGVSGTEARSAGLELVTVSGSTAPAGAARTSSAAASVRASGEEAGHGADTTCLTGSELASRAFAIGPAIARSVRDRAPLCRGSPGRSAVIAQRAATRAAHRLAGHEHGRRQHRSDGEDGDDRRHRHRRAGARDADERRGRRADDELQDAEQRPTRCPPRRGWSASASAVAFGSTRPRLATTTKSSGTMPPRPPPASDDREQRDAAAAPGRRAPARRIARGSKRREEARVDLAGGDDAERVGANSTLKTCGEAP